MENVTQDKAVAALSESGGTILKDSLAEMTQALHGQPRVGFSALWAAPSGAHEMRWWPPER